jgi:hypothetical protein
MFGGKHGSLRKVLYKQRNKSDSSSSATSTSPGNQPTTPTTAEAPSSASPRPSNSFNFPSNSSGNAVSKLPPPIITSPSLRLDDSHFPPAPSSPTTSGIPSASRLRVNDAGFDFNTASYTSSTPSALDSANPLTVDVNCVCHMSQSTLSPDYQQQQQPSTTRSLTNTHRLFAPQLSGPASTNTSGGGQDAQAPVCTVPGHERHHRSISASPQYYSGTGGATSAVRSMPTALNVPLLIPLAPTSVNFRRHDGSRPSNRPLHHRSSLGAGLGAPPWGQRTSPNTTTNRYLAARLDHPTVFDFEDWHTSLDKRECV